MLSDDGSPLLPRARANTFSRQVCSEGFEIFCDDETTFVMNVHPLVRDCG